MKQSISALAALALLLAAAACHPEEKDVVATAIKLSTNVLTLEKGANEVLSVTYTPSNTTRKELTWVSSDTGVATVADGIVVGVAPGSTEIIAKCGDAIDKCKVTVVSPATGIKLDRTSLELHLKESATLVATVEPAGSTDKVTWESSDNSVATVADGVVKGVAGGKAVITAKAGNKKIECNVTVLRAVDLGIVMTREDGSTYRLYWAEANLCETGLCAKPEDYGDYYAWGETEPYYTEGHGQDNPCSSWRSRTNPAITGYNWASYKWCNGSASTLTKYNNDSRFGSTIDNIAELQRGEKNGETKDDAARAKLGGNWRMPTDAEWTALREHCTWNWTKQNGFNGRLVTADNGNSIFLPAAGYRDGTGLASVGSYGYYWSSSLNTDGYPYFAYRINFNSGDFKRNLQFRFTGYSVRPVIEGM
jgi:hypothetical protein